MKSRLFTASLAIGFVTLAPATSFAKGNPNSCGPDVNVSVSFDPGYSITATQTYLAGFQVGNCSYDFVLNLFNSSPQITVLLPGRPPTTAWFFNFDRIGSVPVMDGSPLQTTWCSTIVTTNADGFTYIGTQPLDNYADCRVDVNGPYARRNVGFGLVEDYGLRFQVSPWEGQVGGDAVGTDYIKVYHPSPNTWILEPEGTASPSGIAWSVLRDGSKRRAGAPTYQSMPFRAVVTRLAP